MHPSEYQPYPDDGLGFGDYPKLKDEPVESRDPYYPWDMPELKRNFGDTVSFYSFVAYKIFATSLKIPLFFYINRFTSMTTITVKIALAPQHL